MVSPVCAYDGGRATVSAAWRCPRHHERQSVDALDANGLSDICTLVAARLPEFASNPDVTEGTTRDDDFSLLADHCLRSGLRLPTPRQAEAPYELDRLDGETAEDREQIPWPRQEDESEHDRNDQRHGGSISPTTVTFAHPTPGHNCRADDPRLRRLTGEVIAHEQQRRLPAASVAAENARSDWRARTWVAPLFSLAAVLLVPWVVLLAVVLPSTHRSAHWDIAWAGFDIALALLLLAVAVTAWRRSPWLEGAATAAATLLFIDAWFDVLTSSTQTELVLALIEAVFVELPLALLCLMLARDAERHLAA